MILINLICLFTVIYSADILFFKEIKTVPQNGTEAEEKIAVKEDKKEENKTEAQPETKSGTTVKKEAVETSAEAVKGKIISSYVSPYSAGLKYDGVYVKNSTNLDISVKKYLEAKINFSIKKNDEPQVLILHTHATESFAEKDSEYYTESFKSRTTDNTKNMVAIGKIVAEKLNNAGIKTVHSEKQHDYPQYTGSYTKAAETITSYLKKYPSIKVILDLHRDAISSGESDKVKLVTEIGGKKAAQVMLVMGSQSGNVKNFPKWEENFKLAVKLQQEIEKNYPTLARPVMLASKNYNESLSTGSLLIEFGTDANTLTEAKYSAEMVGDSLVKLLNKLK